VRLNDALTLVLSAGLTEAEAKEDLCAAILEGKIAVQVRIAANEGALRGSVLEGANVGRPSDLSPDDFDWVGSRPRQKWPVGPVGPQNYTWIGIGGWEDRSIDLIKISRADLLKIFGEWNAKEREEHVLPDEKAEELATGGVGVDPDRGAHILTEKKGRGTCR
jgi:hypothetical protein